MPLKLDHDEFCSYPNDCVCSRLGMARAHERRVVSRRLAQFKQQFRGDRICALHLEPNQSCAYCAVKLLFEAIDVLIESGDGA